MIIPRKTKYKVVKRQRIRAAVELRHYRKSPMGFAKDGSVVFGRDIEIGKYNYYDIQVTGMIDQVLTTNLIWDYTALGAE